MPRGIPRLGDKRSVFMASGIQTWVAADLVRGRVPAEHVTPHGVDVRSAEGSTDARPHPVSAATRRALYPFSRFARQW